MSSNTIELRQHNAITEARYEMSALEKNIVYMLMSKISEGDAIEKQYVIDLTELEKRVGHFKKEELGNATSNLLTRSYTIKEGNGDILVVSLMTVVLYDPNNKELRIKISRKILPYFVALKNNYTEFSLDIALSLKSKYSKRMYEILSQHKEIGVLNIPVKELKWRLGLNGKSKETKYIDFNYLQRNVLDVAKKELAKHSDINFNYEALKTGRKYTDLVFQIIRSKSFQPSFF